MRDVSKDPRRWYQAFNGFVKAAKSYGAPLTFLSNLEGSTTRVSVFMSDTGLGIVKLTAGETVDLADKLVVATVPENAVAFAGVRSMDTGLFQQTGQKLGAALMI